MWMFSHDQSGYFIVTETTEPAQVRLRLTSQLNRIMREWSAQRPSRYWLSLPIPVGSSCRPLCRCETRNHSKANLAASRPN